MRAVLFLVLASASLPAAAAVECGASIDRDLVLTHDLVCDRHAVALTVVRSNVRIDLAGHSIRTAAGATAIEIEDSHGVSIHGPGRIEGALSGIDAVRARGLSVRGIHFSHVGEGVRLTNASDADIAGNRFDQVAGHAVVALALPGALLRGGGHRISGNAIVGAEYGVLVDGPWAHASRIDSNRFDDIGTFGVIAPSPAVAVQDNRFGVIGVAAIVD